MLSYKRIGILVITVLMLLACQKEKDYNFTVTGQIKNAPDSTIARLYRSLPSGDKLVDSSKVNAAGQFLLKARTEGPDFFYVSFSGQNYNIYLLVDSGQNIVLSADYRDILNTYRVHGSPQSDTIRMLEQHLALTRQKIDSLAEIYNLLTDKGLTDSAKAVDSVIKQVMAQQKMFSEAFVMKHYQSLLALPALSQTYVPGKGIFDPLDDASLYFLVDTALGRRYPRNPHVLRMHSFVMNIRTTLQRRQSKTIFLKPGDKSPEIVAKTLDGKEFDLYKVTDRYVYLVFWGVWCKSCPQVLEQAAGLRNPKIRVVTFCLAPDSSQVREFLSSHPNLSGLTVLADYKLWNSPVVRQYGVNKLPVTFLIAPDKTLVDINPDIEKLKKL